MANDLTRKRPSHDLTAEEVRHYLDYFPSSGVFVWKVNQGKNSVPGAVAGSLSKKGYIEVKVNNSRCFAHRLAFLWMTGKWPDRQVDHINRIRDDNRWTNLRDVSGSTNNFNSGLPKNNTSGHKGVTWRSDKNKWVARIKFRGQTRHLGYFDRVEDAAAAYVSALATLENDND